MGKSNSKACGRYIVTARDADGNVKWVEDVTNMIVTAGLNYAVGVALAAASQLTAWYVMLVSGTPTIAAGDTMASHGGWTEVTGYSESVRQTWTPGAVSGGAVSNSASKAVVTANSSITVGGVALTSNSTKGGSTGTLFSAVAFAANRSLVSGDTLTIQYDFSQTDDGV